MSSNLRIGFLGAGKMATALAKGFLKAGLTSPDCLLASDPLEPARASFSKETGAGVSLTNPDVLKAAELLILAVKPDHVVPLLAEIRTGFTERHVLISIAAGVSIPKMEGALTAGAGGAWGRTEMRSSVVGCV